MDDSDVGFGKWAAPSLTIVEVLHFEGKHKKNKRKYSLMVIILKKKWLYE